jgi:hypothetical protein
MLLPLGHCSIHPSSQAILIFPTCATNHRGLSANAFVHYTYDPRAGLGNLMNG